MATTIYGSYTGTTGASNFIRPFLAYTITTTDDSVKVTWNAGINVKSNYHTNAKLTCSSTCTGQSNRSITKDNMNYGGGNHTMLSSVTYTYARGTAGATKTLTVKLQAYNSKASTVSLNISVPAKPSYAVEYNSNGGDGSISKQIKWYGTALTLSDGTGFSRANHTLQGWATDTDSASPLYDLGGSYTGNEALTLYAVWKTDYIKPHIDGLKVVRTLTASSTLEDDEGTYIYIDASITKGHIGDTEYTPTCVVTIDGVEKYRGTVSTSYRGHFGGYTVNVTHSVTVQFYDAQDEEGVNESIIISTAQFPLDILADGSAMGIMHVAQRGQTITTGDITIDGELEVLGNVNVTSNLSIDNQPVADFIVETGVKDGWHYEKYKSGKIILRSRQTFTLGATWAAAGGHYRATKMLTIPFNIPFDDRVEMSGTAHNTGTIATVNSDNQSSQTNQIEIIGYKEASGDATYTYRMSICIVGLSYTE